MVDFILYITVIVAKQAKNLIARLIVTAGISIVENDSLFRMANL